MSIMKLLVFSLLLCGAWAQTDAPKPPEVTESPNVQPQGSPPDSDNAPPQGSPADSDSEMYRGMWQTFNGRGFLFLKTKMNWGQAQQHCMTLGGHLATIHNELEDQFVKQVAEGLIAWIGLSNAQIEGMWFWKNNDPLSYTNWCPGQPNNQDSNQHCAEINYLEKGQRCWNDERCTYNSPFVCEKRGPEFSTQG